MEVGPRLKFPLSRGDKLTIKLSYLSHENETPSFLSAEHHKVFPSTFTALLPSAILNSVMIFGCSSPPSTNDFIYIRDNTRYTLSHVRIIYSAAALCDLVCFISVGVSSVSTRVCTSLDVCLDTKGGYLLSFYRLLPWLAKTRSFPEPGARLTTSQSQ